MIMNTEEIKTQDLLQQFQCYESVEDKVQFLMYCQKRFPSRNINWRKLLEVWINKLPDNKTASSS